MQLAMLRQAVRVRRPHFFLQENHIRVPFQKFFAAVPVRERYKLDCEFLDGLQLRGGQFTRGLHERLGARLAAARVLAHFVAQHRKYAHG